MTYNEILESMASGMIPCCILYDESEREVEQSNNREEVKEEICSNS